VLSTFSSLSFLSQPRTWLNIQRPTPLPPPRLSCVSQSSSRWPKTAKGQFGTPCPSGFRIWEVYSNTSVGGTRNRGPRRAEPSSKHRGVYPLRGRGCPGSPGSEAGNSIGPDRAARRQLERNLPCNRGRRHDPCGGDVPRHLDPGPGRASRLTLA
ncbi:hypothetical protein LZ30DRAFT_450964, partial [Colletotrichum cereale]